ncbi:SNF2-related protein [Nocardia xishanensis]|uniref:SNF2-related protein n=1 Tax=Nocardia xishanensis TaxID=238964 RepID=UPI0033D39481
MTETAAKDDTQETLSGETAGRFAAGMQVRIRDEQWLVRQVTPTTHDGCMLEVTGVSAFVRGSEAVFYERLELDGIEVLDPEKTRLVADDSPNHRRGRLYLEAAIRKTALPQTEPGLALADSFLMDRQAHQLSPAALALSMRNPQARILIADVVGLGKTLEIGLLLAELIRRGRGERILVVTPAAVLQQFQRELWTRFAIPLIRLDSTGIQRIQQDIPAGRNPFAYFKRAIISVDTLKSDVYASHLDKTHWDAVVLDESHNLMNRASRNNRLARSLARKTDALIMASATPHNGDVKSFAELIALLDETAIADPSKYDPKDLEHLYIRRTKTSREVRDSLKGSWADRGPSLPVSAQATRQESAVFEQLVDRWIPRDLDAPSVARRPLDAYSLLKAFLSSHRALIETIDTRVKTLTNPKQSDRYDATTELDALNDLRTRAVEITDNDSAKLTTLIAVLDDLGVGPGSDTRVVVFSERRATLTWLAQVVPPLLGFGKVAHTDPDRPWSAFGGAVEVAHSKYMPAELIDDIVDRFGLRDDPLRLLFTGDVTSEGVNLHQQCHQLIHYDLPWSLIRIEQRNGRIDRYGQEHSPEFRAIVLTNEIEWRKDPETGEQLWLDDRFVGAKLLAREAEAARLDGSADAVTGLYDPDREEDRLTRDLIAGLTVEQSLRSSHNESSNEGPDFLDALLGTVAPDPSVELPIATVPMLFDSTAAYFDEALRQAYPAGPESELDLRRDDDGLVAFTPPPDLQYRLRTLPKSYLDEQGILPRNGGVGRLKITFSKRLANQRLKAARDSSTTQWPNVGFVSDIHPVIDWITDKALASLRHDEAFILSCAPYLTHAESLIGCRPEDLQSPMFLVQGVYSNAIGRPNVVEWMAVLGLPGPSRVIGMDKAFLNVCGVGPHMAGRAPRDPDALQQLVPQAVDAARRHLESQRVTYDEHISRMLDPQTKQIDDWQQLALFTAHGTRKSRIDEAAERRRGFIESLRTSGAPMLRLLAVLDPIETVGATDR